MSRKEEEGNTIGVLRAKIFFLEVGITFVAHIIEIAIYQNGDACLKKVNDPVILFKNELGYLFMWLVIIKGAFYDLIILLPVIYFLFSSFCNGDGRNSCVEMLASGPGSIISTLFSFTFQILTELITYNFYKSDYMACGKLLQNEMLAWTVWLNGSWILLIPIIIYHFKKAKNYVVAVELGSQSHF
jgi:hypothetical protein